MLLQHLISNAWVLHSNSAVIVQESKADIKIETSDARNILIFDFRQMFFFSCWFLVLRQMLVCFTLENSFQ